MNSKDNIFNIRGNYHFFESFLQFLNDRFAQNFGQVKIILPNRRSCREFKELLLAKNIVLIPQIKAISDISFEDFFQFKSSLQTKNIIDEISKIKVFDDFDYLIFLTCKIQNYQNFKNLNFYQAFKSAIMLKDLLEEVERGEIAVESFFSVDDSNLAMHRQITLDFISRFIVEIKNSLIKENIYTQSSYQNLLIKYFTEILEKEDLQNPLIIAGSTGSMVFNRKLIKAISQKNNGFVFLYNYQKKEDLKENHPQFLLNNLVDFIENPAVKNIDYEKFQITSEARQNILQLTMLPYEEIDKWQKISNFLDVNLAKKDLEGNFTIIEANNLILEAKIIAKIVAKNKQKKLGIIVNNNDLSNLLKLELTKLEVEFNDARSQKIFDSKLIDLAILIYQLFESDFAASNILAVLKHKLCSFDVNLVEKFEIEILRQERESQGLEGIKNYLKSLDPVIRGGDSINEFFTNFLNLLLLSPRRMTGSIVLDIKSLIKILENLTQKTYLELINQEEAGEEIFYLFEKLQKQNQQILTSDDFKVILSQISYFKPSNAKAKIQILSPIEARLLNFEMIFITSLNEGTFPEIESENWLGRKIRKDLGVDRIMQKIGQNAYDFCNYLSNKNVVLSRAKMAGDVDIIESPFLTKFKTIAHKISANIDCGAEFFAKLKKENQVAKIIHNQEPTRPPLSTRPTQFSITEISKLIANPYFIYCKKILRLKELNKIDYTAGYSEFGSFIHKALEQYIANPTEVNFYELFCEFFTAKDARLVWWSKFEKIFPNFLQQNSQFLNCKNLTEITAKIYIGGASLGGRIDRVIIDGENAHIFDYKSGTIPEKSQVVAGIDPQLTLSALLLLENQLKSYKISSLNYWKLGSKNTDFTIISDDEEKIKLMLEAARAGLEKLFEYFSHQENGYAATDNLKYDSYQNLSRIND